MHERKEKEMVQSWQQKEGFPPKECLPWKEQKLLVSISTGEVCQSPATGPVTGPWSTSALLIRRRSWGGGGGVLDLPLKIREYVVLTFLNKVNYLLFREVGTQKMAPTSQHWKMSLQNHPSGERGILKVLTFNLEPLAWYAYIYIENKCMKKRI